MFSHSISKTCILRLLQNPDHGRRRGHEFQTLQSSKSRTVTARNKNGTNSSHQRSETAQVYLKAKVFFASPIETCNDLQLVPVGQSTLNIATDLHDNIEPKHFEDSVRNKSALGRAFNVFRSGLQNVHCKTFSVKDGKKASVHEKKAKRDYLEAPGSTSVN